MSQGEKIAQTYRGSNPRPSEFGSEALSIELFSRPWLMRFISNLRHIQCGRVMDPTQAALVRFPGGPGLRNEFSLSVACGAQLWASNARGKGKSFFNNKKEKKSNNCFLIFLRDFLCSACDKHPVFILLNKVIVWGQMRPDHV